MFGFTVVITQKVCCVVSTDTAKPASANTAILYFGAIVL